MNQQKSERRVGRWIICLLTCLLVVTDSPGQSGTPGPDATQVVDQSEIEARMKRVEDDSDLSADVKAEAVAIYEQAREVVAQLEQARDELDGIQKLVESGPEQIESLSAVLDAPRAPGEIPADATADDLNTLVSEKQAEFNLARDSLSAQEAADAGLEQFTQTIVEVITDRERSLRKVVQELAAIRESDAPPIVQDARQAYLTARQTLDGTLLEALRVRARNVDLLTKLGKLETEVARSSVAVLTTELSRVKAALQRERERQAQLGRLEAAAALAATAELPPQIQAIAERDAVLKAEIEELIQREAALNESLQSTINQYRDLQDNLSTLQELVSTYGGTEAIGRLLIRRLAQLPRAWDYRKRIRARRKELNRYTHRRIDIDEQLSVRDIDAALDDIMASVSSETGQIQAPEVREQAASFLKAELDTLKKLDQTYGRFMTRLTAVDSLEKKIEDIATETRDFIRKQLVWIPSLPPLSPGDLTNTPQSFAWLFSPGNWGEALRNAGLSFLKSPVGFGAATIVLILIFASRRRARRRLPELAELSRRIRTDSFAHTWKAFGYTLVAASSLPLLFVFLSTLLEAEPTPEDASFSLAVGHTLWQLAPILFMLATVRWVTHAQGLAPRHFRWPVEICRSLHTKVTMLAWVVIPAGFITELAVKQGEVAYALGMGRPALLIGLAAIAIFAWATFNRSGAFGDYLRDKPDGWAARLWIVWFPIVLGIPIGLIVMSALGYQVAAYLLTSLLLGETLWLLVALFLVYEILMRWFTVAARKSQFEATLQHREERAEREHDAEERSGSSGVEIEVPEVDYLGLGVQARAVIRVAVFLGLVLGAGIIWGELLPVLGLLEQVELPFSKLESVDGIDQQTPVDLADVLFGVLIFAGAMFVASNLSGIMEFTLLRRLRLDAGGNYAIVTLCQYLIVAIGIIAGFSAIGLQWSKLQWLIAALGVGLGFGLQEIVANFISGIILLFERPVRIGDIVTVGNADGYVSRIRIRATTILTWDRKELIIPNKEFITGQVINWTLSDSLTRITLNVGVAYGSDVNKALELLGEVASESEYVLENPAPIITFEAFGDNALTLCMRCHIQSMDDLWPARTALHTAVNEKFSEAGISIAFPQRDVHLDTSRPLEINVRRGPSPAPSS